MNEEITKESVQALPTKEEVEALLDGVTPGEWRAVWNRSSVCYLVKSIPESMQGETPIVAECEMINRNENKANSLLISKSKVIAQAYVKQCEVIEGLVQALDFYTYSDITDIYSDYGDIGKKALKAAGVEG